jgi:hypothetical protein
MLNVFEIAQEGEDFLFIFLEISLHISVIIGSEMQVIYMDQAPDLAWTCRKYGTVPMKLKTP